MIKLSKWFFLIKIGPIEFDIRSIGRLMFPDRFSSLSRKKNDCTAIKISCDFAGSLHVPEAQTWANWRSTGRKKAFPKCIDNSQNLPDFDFFAKNSTKKICAETKIS